MANEDPIILPIIMEGLDTIVKGVETGAKAIGGFLSGIVSGALEATKALTSVSDAAAEIKAPPTVVGAGLSGTGGGGEAGGESGIRAETVGKVEKAAEATTAAIKGTTTAATDFLKVLDDFSATDAVETMEKLAEGAAKLLAQLGPTAAALGGLVTGLTALGAAYAGLEIAETAVAVSGSRDIIALDDLAKVSGASIEQIVGLKEAFTKVGGEADSLYRVMRNVAINMQTQWPAIARSVRDSADNIEADAIRVRNAIRALETTKAEAALAPGRTEVAEVGYRDAQRAFVEEQRNSERAAIAVQEAFLNQAKAVERLHEAQRGVVEAQIESKNAAIAVQEARLGEERAAFATIDAQRALVAAQQESKNAATAAQQASLTYEQAVYNYEVKHGERQRDIAYERQLQDQQELAHIEELRQAKEAAQERLRAAPEGVAKAEIAVREAPLQQQKAAEASQQAALRLAASADKQEAAAIAFIDAELNVKTTALAFDSASANLDASGDKLIKAGEAMDEAAETWRKAAQDQAASADKIEQARITAEKARFEQQDNLLKDVVTVQQSIFPAKGERPSVDFTQAPVGVQAQAVERQGVQEYGGGALGVLKALAEAISTNPDIGQALQRAIVGRLSPTDSEALTALLKKGPEALEEKNLSPLERELVAKATAPGAIQGAQGVVAEYGLRKEDAEAIKDLLSIKVAPETTAQLKALGGVLESLGSDKSLAIAVEGLHSLQYAIIGLAGAVTLLIGRGLLSRLGGLIGLGGGAAATTTAAATAGTEAMAAGAGAGTAATASRLGLLGVTALQAPLVLAESAAVSHPFDFAGQKAADEAEIRRLDEQKKSFFEFLRSVGDFFSGTETAAPVVPAGRFNAAAPAAAESISRIPEQLTPVGAPLGTSRVPEQLTPVGAPIPVTITGVSPSLGGPPAASYFSELGTPAQSGITPPVGSPAAGIGIGGSVTVFDDAVSRFAEAVSRLSLESRGIEPRPVTASSATPGAAATPTATSLVAEIAEALKAIKVTEPAPVGAAAADQPLHSYVPIERRFNPYGADTGVYQSLTDVRGTRAPGDFSANQKTVEKDSIFAQREAAEKHKAAAGDTAAAAKALKEVAEKFAPVVQALVSLVGQLGKIVLGTSKAEGHAEGGHIRGPGGPTGDRIPAMLSDGEYVVQAKAVKHFGVAAMHAINNMTMPHRGLVDGHFSLGGLVSNIFPTAPVMMASGGLAATGTGTTDRYHLDLRTDFGRIPATVHGDTMKAIQRSAVGSKLTRTGISPGWYK